MKRATPQNRHIGQKIAECRTARGWSQSDLPAQMQLHDCDLTTDMIGKIEIGYRAVSVYEIDKFVEVFGVTYDELFAR